MSNFDIVIGLSESSVNKLVAALFADPVAKNKFFSDTYNKDVANGNVSFNCSSSYEVKASPTVTLVAPDPLSWDNAIKETKNETRPTSNCLQVHFSSISGSISIDNGSPVNAEGQLDVYLTAAMNNGVLSFEPLAVHMDMSNLSELDKWLIPNLLVPAALERATKILSSIKLPSIPSYEGIAFKPPGMTIINGQLILGTVLTSNGADVSLSTFSFPSKDYYTLLNPTLINTIISAQIPTIEAKFEPYKSDEKKVGNDVVAWAKGTYNVNLKDINAWADASNPTKINLSVKADISVSGSAGGIVPALACPIGAALNAF
jgi:hypothetical protein